MKNQNKFYVNNLLVLQNFTIARKAETFYCTKNVSAFSCNNKFYVATPIIELLFYRKDVL